MSVYTYAEDGERLPFDPLTAGTQLAGCILCGRPRIATIGIFVPSTDEMLGVILRLRQHAPREQSTPGLVYGLCEQHTRGDVTARVEAVLVAAARKVVVQ